MKAVILLSGGLDSCVAASQMLISGHDLIPLSIDYGQKHRYRELDAARHIALRFQKDYPHLKFDHWTMPIDQIMRNGLFSNSSALLGSGEIPDGHYAEDSMKATVVPNRNMILLSIATAVAIANDAGIVIYAAHAGDHAIYPDCRPDFASAMSGAIAAASEAKIYLSAPFINLSKADIVSLGAEYDAPMELTWSCYKGGVNHCGRCGTCVERAEAFSLAGIDDPTVYDDPEFWKSAKKEGCPATLSIPGMNIPVECTLPKGHGGKKHGGGGCEWDKGEHEQ